MESGIEELCDKFGGLWQLIKTPEYKFCEENLSALEEIIEAIRHYKLSKRELKINYIGVNNQIPRYSIEFVKSILEGKCIPYSNFDSDDRLCRMAYESCKSKIQDYTEVSLRLRRIFATIQL